MIMRKFAIILSIAYASGAFAQTPDEAQLDQLAKRYTKASLPMLKEFLEIPNDAAFPQDIERNTQWCERAFQARGFATTRLATPSVPLLLADRKIRKAEKTVLVYLQVDGQPVDTAKWAQANPFKPVLKKQAANGRWEALPWRNIEDYQDDWRVFARSSSDAKGPIAMFLSALDAVDGNGFAPNYNIKVIMDFEEELGSPHLPEAVGRYAEKLRADMLVIFDGPKHITNKPTLTFGARGIATVTLTTYGPVVPQHSGHFGNYAPNPALRLAKLLASMKDDHGRVTIPGFYDGVAISPDTEKMLRKVPDDEQQIRERLQISSTDKVGRFYQEAIQYPSLNIRGMQSGWVDEKARTIIPGQAKAEIDIRLVLETDPVRLIGLVRKHIEKQGYHVIGTIPDKAVRMGHEKVATFTHKVSYQSFRTGFDTEVGLWLRKALNRAFGEPPVMIRMSGGSIPISPFVNTLGIPAVTVPTVNRDNNQHSPNENLRLGNYRDGIKTMISILTEPL